MYFCLDCKHINSESDVLTDKVLFRVDNTSRLGWTPVLKCVKCFQSNLQEINLFQALRWMIFRREPYD